MEALRPLLKGEAASVGDHDDTRTSSRTASHLTCLTARPACVVQECSDMVIRSLAAARTFKRRVEAQIVAVGEIADDFNFNTDKKRVLNQK